MNVAALPVQSRELAISYGRCVYTYTRDNLRLFPSVARDSEAWDGTYKRRTSVERSNKREKVDYKLEAGRHRSTKMWLIRIFGTMMCQHLDAWRHGVDIDLGSMPRGYFCRDPSTRPFA